MPIDYKGYTTDDKVAIIAALRKASEGIAELWDALREIENRDAVVMEYGPNLLDMIAGECSIPADSRNIASDTLWEDFINDVKVTYDRPRGVKHA